MFSRCGSQVISLHGGCDNDDNDGHSNEASCDNDDGNDDNDGGRDGVRMLRLESSAGIQE